MRPKRALLPTGSGIDLVAEITPPIAGLTVYFKVWDVDDPFDQLNPDMPDVGLIDNDTNGPDNRPAGESAWIDSDVTDENGEARVTFTVSMQPGNNYRAGASTVLSAMIATTQGQVAKGGVVGRHSCSAPVSVPLRHLALAAFDLDTPQLGSHLHRVVNGYESVLPVFEGLLPSGVDTAAILPSVQRLMERVAEADSPDHSD